MAKASVKAPVGHHFMVNADGAFYLMKTAATGYVEHTHDDYTSQLSILMEVVGTHSAASTTQRTATATSSSGSTTRTTSTMNTGSTTTRSTGGGGGY